MELSWKHLTLLIFAGIIASAKAIPGKSSWRNCGLKPSYWVAQVVGGIDTELHEWPWQVALREGNSIFCGGTLIAHRWVVTAAHCLVGVHPGFITVSLGEHDKHTVTDTNFTVNVRIKDAIKHRDYNKDVRFNNDIALLKLEDYEPNSAIHPVCLPTVHSKSEFIRENVTVTGWGKTETGLPSILQEVELRIISNDECSEAYEDSKETITKNMVCNYSYGKDACKGDSGGPVVWKSPVGNWNLVGVVSTGNGCAKIGSPGINTRVTEYLEWIKTTTGENFQ